MNEVVKKNSGLNKVTIFLLTIYLLALCWIIVFKMKIHISSLHEARSINLIPFDKPARLHGEVDYGENVLNVLVFIPLGIYSGVLFKRFNFWIKLCLFSFTSLAFEICQYILRIGIFDITDIITNTFGAIAGLLVFNVLDKLFTSRIKAHQFINIIAIMGTIIVLTFLLLLKTGNLWLFGKNIRYQ